MATETQIKAIINKIAPYAQLYAETYGYALCSPCIAQALQESLGKYDGLSLLAFKYNNYHGIKAYPKWTGASVNMSTGEEYTAGSITNVRSNFCVYDDMPSGIEGYYQFLERNKRYANLKACATPESYIQTIKADGYCTSTTYVTNCIAKINKYNLAQYDNFKREYVKGQTYTLATNLYVRSEPFGEKIKYECITKNAKQMAHFDDYGNAILEKGLRATCIDVKELTASVWVLIPSGWICASEGDKVYLI